MARAGVEARYPWGDEIGEDNALCLYCTENKEGESIFESIEVGSYQPNEFGIYDVIGSVREWVEDCWNKNYTGAPSDGTAWTEGNCNYRVQRGGGYYNQPQFLTLSSRELKSVDHRERLFGVRLVREISKEK